MLPSLSTRLH